MKKVFSIGASFVIALILFTAQVNMSSCTKTNIVMDTVTVKDTVTVTIHDTTNVSATMNLWNGLVAYYTFTNGSTSDSSGNNNNIVFNNATPVTDRFGHANNAYLFNGTSSYMMVNNSASLNPQTGISLMAIFKPNYFYPGACGANNLLSKGEPDYVDGYYALRYTNFGSCNSPVDSSDEIFYGTYGDNTGGPLNAVADPNTLVQEGQWYNLIYTYNAGIGKLYINGVLKNTDTTTSTFTPATSNLYIGKHGDPSIPYYFNGILDEVRIYNRALNPCEVSYLNNLTY
jgi:hypothetical protein